MISHERLLKLLNYDRETGIFTWRVDRRKMRSGSVAGVLLSSGYIQIMIDYTHYSAHRLAWFYVHGKWPDDDIDHIDLIKSNNSLSNLREETASQNGYNIRKKTNTSSAWKGVTYDPGRRKCWKMAFRHPDGYKIQVRYEDEREAAEEYMFLALHHHGEFVRLD